MILKTYDAFTRLSTMEAMRLTDFLYDHLDGYAASRKSVLRAIQYSTKEIPGLGGYVFVAEKNDELIGAVIINKTGMGDYITENHLVFIAVHRSHRNQGVGKKLMRYALAYCKGTIALHSKPMDKAMALFKSLGFYAEYVEMRLQN
ncbi:GNAT family N-acetyltransferase [Allomuricauda sp. d1]|uniref:GNAT family N-acetyltransferase n=1 Tax=Allomuricauda sp. d1 TaxID=3136725 RepID=UPI0031D817D6